MERYKGRVNKELSNLFVSKSLARKILRLYSKDIMKNARRLWHLLRRESHF